MSRRSSRACATTLFTALIIVMTACGGSTPTVDETSTADADSTASSSTSAPETPTGDAEATDTPAAADDAEDSADDEADGGSAEGEADEGDDVDDGDDDGSCIEGDWMVTDAQLDRYYAEIGAAAGLPMSASGTVRIRFIDLQFVYDAVFELEIDIEGEIATARGDGVATGSYVIEDGTISTELGANSLSVVVNVAGFEMDAGELGNDLLSSFPINDAPYSCDGPTIFFETGGAERHAVELTPYEG